MLWITRVYRRYYLWAHKKYRETQERLHLMKIALKTVWEFDSFITTFSKELKLAENTSTRKVLIEKYTQKDREKEMERQEMMKRIHGTTNSGPR